MKVRHNSDGLFLYFNLMKLFNKIRFNMIEGKRLKNYLIYAIGEIILVIVGILFALGINNYNNERQLKETNVGLQKKVLAQLDKDLKVIADFQKDIDTTNQTYRKVLDRDYDKSKVNDNGVISTVLFEMNTLSLNQQLINLVDNAKLDESYASKELIEISSMYKLYMNDIKGLEDIVVKKMTDNLTEIEQTQPWYAELMTDFVCKNDCINYLLKDEGHKSRLASLRFVYVNGYGGVINSFYDDVLLSRANLDALINK